ncbi:hypothetical protein NEMIN01_0328 [Nematocida minor]|uniref:uncharacterized protein n=1 Tax=Nematocida minor TaxID=1912983 RepID=UPI00221F3F33|nr:uncharacterized protein NEMIN01_0328 [Nematocida minor]KAI5189162.1 hypothetical protein NEMIN01_0328 [Nematocida minor]
MPKKAKREERGVSEDYAYLISQGYFADLSISERGYKTFLKSTSLFYAQDSLKTAWLLKQEANSVYYDNPPKAYRLWLESLLLYMEAQRSLANSQELIIEVIAFAESISKFIQPNHVRARRIFVTVKISLEYHLANIQSHFSRVNSVIQRAYLNKVVVIPHTHLGMYIKESLNSIYYN